MGRIFIEKKFQLVLLLHITLIPKLDKYTGWRERRKGKEDKTERKGEEVKQSYTPVSLVNLAKKS